MTIKYFTYTFGQSGTLAAIPDPTQLSGVVSYQEGFGPDYALINTDPASLTIPRDQFNQLMNDVTGAIQQIQQNGYPIHVTAAMNDGSPLAYSKNSYVRATDGNIYYSLVNSNTDVPPTANWQLVGAAVNLYLNYAVDTGAVNAYVTAPSPAALSYVAGLIVVLKPGAANTGASTINVNGLGVKNIKTLANQNPTASMMIPTGSYFLFYDGTNFVLMNPSPVAGLTAVVSVKQQVFTSGGTYVPSTGMLYCIAEIQGAGGAGGCGGSASYSAGAGGGAGTYARSLLTAATITGSQSVTIGAGGAAGSAGSGATGGSGGASSLGSLISCPGGTGGTNQHLNGSQFGVGGGSATGSQVNIFIEGQSGVTTTYSASGYASQGGSGGSSILGQGGTGGNRDGGVNPSNATGYGSGGAGGGGTQAATNGANGIVIITEYCSQ